jgi:hypothetical protein
MAYLMANTKTAFLRPWQVRVVLREHNLMGRVPPPPATLRKPKPPDRPNQLWHIDIMYVRIVYRPNNFGTGSGCAD